MFLITLLPNTETLQMLSCNGNDKPQFSIHEGGGLLGSSKLNIIRQYHQQVRCEISPCKCFIYGGSHGTLSYQASSQALLFSSLERNNLNITET